MPEKWILRELQALPLSVKVKKTQIRIREWYEHYNGNVCVSFSGGKDSTVLATIVRDLYPDIPLVFANTGLEYPEIQAFARKMGAEFVRPAMRFDEVISNYGYPIISKEIGDAIYYARRIRNAGLETERRRGNLIGDPESWRNPRESVPYGEKATEYFQRQLTGGVGIGTDGTIWIHGSQNRIPETLRQRQALLHDQINKDEWMISEDGTRIERIENAENSMGGGTGWQYDKAGKRNQLLGGRGKATQNKREELTGTRVDKIEDDESVKETSSIFNKVKWLPLCQEADFRISANCCSKMKKGPMRIYQRRTKRLPILGTLAEESKLREQAWVRHGCNAFDSSKPTSQPLSFWTEQDILHYIYAEGIEIASVYGDIVAVDGDGMEYEPPFFANECKLKCSGCQRTGCIFCGFGAHLDKGRQTRFQRLAFTHPRQYEYCMGGGQWVDNPAYDPVAPEYDGEWKNWNPKKIWVPSKEGLGMRHVFDECNQIYGKDFIRYE